MESQKLISIIIPVYNVENYLEKCLNSVISQTYKSLEIITVNDGSTDKSLAILQKYKKMDNRIIIVEKKNGGLSDARNVGIETSTGEYLFFLDSDDYLDITAIEKMYNQMKKENDIVICNRYYVYEDKTLKLRFKNNNNTIQMNKEEALNNLLLMKNYDMSATMKLFKSNLFKDIKFPVGKTSEDYYIMYQLFDKANKISYLPEPLYYYFQRNGSISKNKTISFDYIEAAKNQMEYITSKYSKLKKNATYAYSMAYLTIYNKALRSNAQLSKEQINMFKKELKKNFRSIIFNNEVSPIRKMQYILFLLSKKIYDLIFFKIYV